MKTLFLTILLTLTLSPLQASAGQGEFCAGFKEGYKMVKGELVIPPICPIAPITPIDSTDFREGIKAGIEAASLGE